MDTSQALLAAIAAEPENDLPRLVYADWLDENGQSIRAEFIRLQIEIAHKEILPRAQVDLYAHLWKREHDLLEMHRDEFLGELDSHLQQPNSFGFHRGFLEWVLLDFNPFVASAIALNSLTPTPRVRLQATGGSLDRLAAIVGSKSIVELRVIADPDLDFPENPHEFVHGLQSSVGSLRNLHLLDLEACHMGDLGLPLVFAPDTFPKLEDLDLSFNDLTDYGVHELLNTGVPQRLKRLVLGGNPIGDAGAIELADRLGSNNRLEHLNLRMTNIGRAGHEALLAMFGGKIDLF